MISGFSWEVTFMGVEVSVTEKKILVAQRPDLKAGAIAVGTAILADNLAPGSVKNITKIDANKLTWSVCPHLSKSDKIIEYYMSSGLIVIAYGKCFCESCLDMIISQDNFSELANSSIAMTDKLFQHNFIDPLIHSNYNFSKSIGYIGVNEESPKTWISCSHLATEHGLKKVYSTGGQICIFENYFTCQHCFDNIATDSLVDLLYNGTSMTDTIFQEKIIDPLCSINYCSLESLSHFDLYGNNIKNNE
jgi:hypothetical protein